MSTNRNTNSGDGRRMMNVRVDPGQLARFREVAEANHRTVSQELRLLMEQRIAEADSLEEAA